MTIVTQSVRDEIIAMAKRRVKRVDIAKDIGGDLTASYVGAVLTQARRDGHEFPRLNKPRNCRRVVKPSITREQHEYLETAAKPRGIPVDEMVSRLIATVAQHKMVDNIMDDGVGL